MQAVASIIAEARAAGHTTLSEYDSKRVLAAYGIPVTREALVSDPAGAEAAAARIGYPVVLKACAAGLAHKTEQGLIAVGITSPADLRAAFTRLADKSGAFGGHLLVQEMVQGSRELVAGLVRDAHFGPCVMFGLGGVFTEILQDVAFRVAPLGMATQRRCARRSGPAKSWKGCAGSAPVDTDVLGQCLQNLGRIGLEHPAIGEIDVNPLIIRAGRAAGGRRRPGRPAGAAGGNPAGGATPGGARKILRPRERSDHRGLGDTAQTRQRRYPKYPGQRLQGSAPPGEPQRRRNRWAQGLPVDPETCPRASIRRSSSCRPPPTPRRSGNAPPRGSRPWCWPPAALPKSRAGEALQQETIDIVRETGVRIIGPNTSGHTSTPHGFTSSFFPLGKIPRGHVSYIAQTGNFATHTMRYIASGENFGVARVVGLGNKLDVEESEVLAYYGDDPETSAIFIYLESFKRPRRFLEIARQVTRSKPVVLLKGGATAEGARAAVAHTAALASDDRIIDGALRQAGVVRVHKYSHLILAAKAVAAMPLPRGNRVSFLAPSGAMLVCMTDLCRRHLDLEVPPVTEETRQYLQSISPPFIRMRNPVDIWAATMGHGVEFGYREGIEAVLKDPNIDAVVPILMLTDETGVPPFDFLVDLARRYPEKPLYVTFSAQKKHMEAAKAFLEPRGVPTFPLIEEPFEVLGILNRCRQAMDRP